MIDLSGSTSATFNIDAKAEVCPQFRLISFQLTSCRENSTPLQYNYSRPVSLVCPSPGDFFAAASQAGVTLTLRHPSIITLGPEFSINAEASIDLKAEAKMAVKAAWDFPTVKLIFPEEKGASTGDATVSNTNNRMFRKVIFCLLDFHAI